MSQPKSPEFLHGCEGVHQCAVALLTAIACVPGLSARDKIMAQRLVSDSAVMVFNANPEAPIDVAKNDASFQAFKAALMPRLKRTRKSKNAAA